MRSQIAMGKGIVAQLVEQRTENPCVTGSIPVDATTKNVKTPKPSGIGVFVFYQCFAGTLQFRLRTLIIRFLRAILVNCETRICFFSDAEKLQ